MLKISGANDDYIKNIKGISLNGKGLFNKSQVGSGEDYNIEDNNIYIYIVMKLKVLVYLIYY